MESSVKIKSSILLKKEKAKSENNMKEYIKQIYELLQIEYKDLDNYLIDCNYLINHNELEEAKELLKIIINLNNNNSNKIEKQINYLVNKINEIEYKENMSLEDKKNYILYKETAEQCINMNRRLNAVMYYIKALELTKQNEFNYYIGKELYKLKYYDDAKIYLNEYLKKGTDKIAKCIFYLCEINRTNEINVHINKLINDCRDISELCDFEFTLGNFYESKKRYKKPNSIRQNKKMSKKRRNIY